MDEPVPANNPPASEQVVCPSCGQPLPNETDPLQPFACCPHCEPEFPPDSIEEIEDLVVEWEEPAAPEDELDGLRIRKLVQLRRSAIRARTYAIVVLICCMVMGAQLIFTDFQEVGTYGWDRWAILYSISAGAMVIGATIASRKAAKLHRESNISHATESEHTPRFDQLSDGSHRVRNLEQMHNPNSNNS